MQTSVKKRQSNFELYRIILMLLVITHHYVVNSGMNMLAYGDMFSAHSQWLLQLGGYGKSAINGFVLLTGYFMCGREISWKKWLNLFIEYKFYQILLFFIFFAFHKETLSFSNIFCLLMPVTALESNFMECFLIFYLCIPFLNKLVFALNAKEHFLLLLLTIGSFSVLGTVPTVHVTFNYVSWFSILFLVAAYIKRYPAKWMDSQKICVSLLIFSLFCSGCSILLGGYLTQKINLIVVFSLLQDSHKFLALTNAVFSFLVFRNLHLGYSSLINVIASSVFGIFLIHTNPAMRSFLWGDFLRNTEYFHSPYLYLHTICSVLFVFAGGFLIDQVRQKLFQIVKLNKVKA